MSTKDKALEALKIAKSVMPAAGMNSTLIVAHERVDGVIAALSSPSSTVMDEKGADFIVSVVMTRLSEGVVNTQNKLYGVSAVRQQEAHGKAIPLAQADFPEHAFHTACAWALTAPAPSAAEPVAPGWTSQEIIEACDATGIDDRTFRRLMSALKVLDKRTRAPALPRPDDDALWDKTLKERDDYHEWADQLAARISSITGVEIGEHSSANCPWQNAVDAADEFSYGPTPDKAPTAMPCGRTSMCSDCSECGGEPQCIPSPEPVVARDAAWTSTEDGLPAHGQLVLCELDDETSASLGINFGFSVETWDEHHTLGGVVRWLPLNRLPETAADQAVLDRLAAPPAPQPTEAEAMEPVEGDVLPPIGTEVLIHLARQDEWVKHTVAGYYVWPGHGDPAKWRVNVRVRDSAGYLNARSLQDLRHLDGSPWIAALQAEAPVAEPVAEVVAEGVSVLAIRFLPAGMSLRAGDRLYAGASSAAEDAKDAKDAERLRKLGRFIADGSWGVLEGEINDRYGRTIDHYVDDLDDLRTCIDAGSVAMVRAVSTQGETK